jgi:4-diphosphocytidyl-2-C-methyl-D-erythritol kinase
MGNVLERVTVDDYPIIDDIKRVMMEAGALNAMMSGSGPTVFGIFDDKRIAKEAQRKMKSSGLTKQIYLVNVHNNRRK